MNPIYKTYHHEQFGAIAAIRTDTETGYLLESISRLRGISSEEIRKMVPSQWFIRGIDGERYVLAIALPIIFPDSGEDDPLMTWLYNHIHEGLCAEQSRTPKAPDSSFLTAQEFQQFVDENGGHVLTEFLETKVEEALGLINQKLPGNLCRVLTVDGQPSIEIPTGNGENYDHLVIRALESTISDPFAALIPVSMKARGGTALTEYLLTQVLPNVYAASPTACAAFPPAADHHPRGKLLRWRCYRKDLGEARMVFLGTRAWLNLSDITRITRFNSGLITEVVGKSQAITIPCSDLSNSDGNSGSEVYILAEAFFRLLKASDYPLERSKALESWIEGLQCPRRQLASGRFVYASTLHRMLRQHMPFQYWIRNLTRMQPGPVELMLENDPAYQYEPEGNDHRVPLTKALEIAKLVGGDAGRLVSILIQDGGFQHGGHAAESMNATLLRFQGLMPDHLGQVNARCVHEFTNKREPFEVWVEQQAKLNGYYYPPLRYELITLDEAESRGIWDTNKRACYYGMS